MTDVSSRAVILAALRAAARPPVARPQPAQRPAAPADLLAALRAAVEAAGGSLGHVPRLAHDGLERLLPGLREARHVWSSLPGISARGVALEATRPQQLDGLEYALLRGELAVAESGAVWSWPAGPLERAAALLAEHLVLVVPRQRIVPHLHAAYLDVDAARAPFGWLIAGPSKTADIEQALVHGAHGPRALTLLLEG